MLLTQSALRGIEDGSISLQFRRWKRPPFKADVRKLKSLGLTESLSVGYELSPRGLAVLKAMLSCLVLCLLLLGCSMPTTDEAFLGTRDQVITAERAFARSMADRDLQAFSAFVSDEAVFFSGSTPLRGKPAVIEAWTAFFSGPEAPFSWEPETVELLESGSLALSTGPVRDPSGKLVATFTSIWRLEAPGIWRIVFDKGNDVCE